MEKKTADIGPQTLHCESLKNFEVLHRVAVTLPGDGHRIYCRGELIEVIDTQSRISDQIFDLKRGLPAFPRLDDFDYS